jgi:hypothetical protein
LLVLFKASVDPSLPTLFFKFKYSLPIVSLDTMIFAWKGSVCVCGPVQIRSLQTNKSSLVKTVHIGCEIEWWYGGILCALNL